MGHRQSKFITVEKNRLSIDSSLPLEDIIVVWLDTNTHDTSDASSKFLLNQLHLIVNSIRTFSDADLCEQFIKNNERTLFLIVSGPFSKFFIPRIHHSTNIDSIYLFCHDKVQEESWTNEFSKVKERVFNRVPTLCDQLQQDIRHCKNDLIPINLFNDTFSRNKLNQLESGFMYSQLLKEVLINFNYDHQAKEIFIDYCRAQYSENLSALSVIEEFDRDYEQYSPIWWYTRECFAYETLNRALRTQNVDALVKMGFFMRDLHRQIEGLYLSQKHSPMIVYRGQGLGQNQFEKLCQCQGGLLSFYSFLSTSTDKHVSLKFARRAREKPDLRGIVFHMKIDPKMAHSSSPYASLSQLSYHKREKEILFSMHTVFRIGSIRPMKDEHNIWEVDLELTSEQHDIELGRLTQYMRQEVNTSSSGWHSLGKVMLAMGELDKAEEVYQTLLERTNKDDTIELAFIYHQLGYVHTEKKNIDQALDYFLQSLTLKVDYLPQHEEDPQLADTYSNIGSILDAQGDLTGALEYFQRALRTNTVDQRILASIHNNIGMVYKRQGDFDQALINFRKSLRIDLDYLPSTHPDLGITYSNIAGVYSALKDYSNTVIYLKKALHILKSSLPANHPVLLLAMNQYKLALEYESPQNSSHSFEQNQNMSHKKAKDNHNEHSETSRRRDKVRAKVSNCVRKIKKETSLRLNPFQ